MLHTQKKMMIHTCEEVPVVINMDQLNMGTLLHILHILHIQVLCIGNIFLSTVLYNRFFLLWKCDFDYLSLSRHGAYNSHSHSSQSSMYDTRSGGSNSNSSSNSYTTGTSSMPIHPDVKFINLPFFNVIDVLVKPTSLGKCPLFIC